MRPQGQHLLSFSRVLLGVLICAALHNTRQSWLVLPAVIAACAADYYDGILARRLHRESDVGRLIDNVSDASFLALAFSAFARATTWSDPVSGSAVRYWEHANWLPLIGLALSFGTYLLLWAFAFFRGDVQERSARGHHAGILNYVLALVGGVAVVPGLHVSPWLIEPSSVSIALFNVMAATDTIGIIARGSKRRV